MRNFLRDCWKELKETFGPMPMVAKIGYVMSLLGLALAVILNFTISQENLFDYRSYAGIALSILGIGGGFIALYGQIRRSPTSRKVLGILLLVLSGFNGAALPFSFIGMFQELGLENFWLGNDLNIFIWVAVTIVAPMMAGMMLVGNNEMWENILPGNKHSV